MGKTAILAIVAFTITGAFYSLSSERNVLEAEEQLSRHQYQELARNAARLGYERAKQQLARDFTNTGAISGVYGEHSEATYDVTIGDESAISSILDGVTLTSDDEVIVTSTGTVERSGKQPIEVAVVSVMRDKTVLSSEIQEEEPEFMNYALIAQNDLDLDGNLTVETDDSIRVKASEDAVYNANVHTNGTLTVSGKAATIKGFGTYVDYENVAHEEVFQPYDNSSEDPVVQQVGSIPMGLNKFDTGKIYTDLNSSNKEETVGDLTLSGEYDFAAKGATREEPYIWHVTGNLTADGGVTLDGYVMFLVDGSIDFQGNMQAGQSGSEYTENHMAFYSQGNVNIGGTVDVLWGQVYTAGDVTFNGTPSIRGTITSNGTATLKGTPNIYYYPASPALTTFWGESDTILELVSYSEM